MNDPIEALQDEHDLLQQEVGEYKLRDASHRKAAQLKEEYIMGLLEKLRKAEDTAVKERLRASVAEAKLARMKGPPRSSDYEIEGQ